jgi:hypothetical protein
MADPAHYVELACERAKAWLADALEHGDIDQIVELKSQAEAIRIYTTQKKLGKDAELAAAEVVRRAERGLGLAIRRGQEDGTVETREQALARAGRANGPNADRDSDATVIRPGQFFTDPMVRSETYKMTDGISDEQFEEALSEAKAEGNLSRANLVRKVRGQAPDAPRSEFNRGRHHIDHYRVLNETIATLEGLATGLGLLDVSAIPVQEREKWAEHIRVALRPLTKFVREVSRG